VTEISTMAMATSDDQHHHLPISKMNDSNGAPAISVPHPVIEICDLHTLEQTLITVNGAAALLRAFCQSGRPIIEQLRS
jgi:hypothetical protein